MELSFDPVTRTAFVDGVATPLDADPIGDLLDADGNAIASGSVDDLVTALGADLKRRSDDRLDDFIAGWAAEMRRRTGTTIDDDEFHGMGSMRMRIERR